MDTRKIAMDYRLTHWTTLLQDGMHTVLQLDDSGTVVNRFTRSTRLIRSDNHGWYVFNSRGDVVALTDDAGNVTRTYRYSAFGVLETTKNGDVGSTDTNPFKFGGEYFDRATGTYYLRARNFDPRRGRFLTEDPYWNVGNMIFGSNPTEMDHGGFKPDILAILQSANLYVYVGNNPIMWMDPTGLFWQGHWHHHLGVHIAATHGFRREVDVYRSGSTQRTRSNRVGRADLVAFSTGSSDTAWVWEIKPVSATTKSALAQLDRYIGNVVFNDNRTVHTRTLRRGYIIPDIGTSFATASTMYLTNMWGVKNRISYWQELDASGNSTGIIRYRVDNVVSAGDVLREVANALSNAAQTFLPFLPPLPVPLPN